MDFSETLVAHEPSREELKAEIERLRAALQAVVDDIHAYEKVNNLAPNPGRSECWDSAAHAMQVLGKSVKPRSSEATK